jgi:tetratricopeptide (TPR) repeat protein
VHLALRVRPIEEVVRLHERGIDPRHRRGELIAKHQLVPPPTPRSLVGEVPVPLDRLITSMLAKSPNDRPQTMGMVEDALAEIDSRTVEGPSLAGDTMPDAAAYAPTTVMPSAIRRRLPLIAGGIGAAMLGIIAGLFTMCGDKKPSAQANIAEQGSSAEPSRPVVVEVPLDAAPDSDRLRSELALDCQQAQADAKWTVLAACSEKLKPYDQDAARKFAIVATHEILAEKTLAEIEALMAKNQKESAQKLLEKIPPDSFYRQRAESRIAQEDGNVTAPANCDAKALSDKGMENVNMGQHAAALAQFEASLRCKQDSYVLSLAFMAACNAQNASKAQVYWGQLSPAMQSKYKVMCIRNHIDPENPTSTPAPKTTAKSSKATSKSTPSKTTTTTTTTAPASCDADELKDKGMENVNMGQHAAALAQFEASLRCKNDSYVLSLAFMAACNSQNVAKAKVYYPKLSPREREKYKVMCVRNKIDLGD